MNKRKFKKEKQMHSWKDNQKIKLKWNPFLVYQAENNEQVIYRICKGEGKQIYHQHKLSWKQYANMYQNVVCTTQEQDNQLNLQRSKGPE